MPTNRNEYYEKNKEKIKEYNKEYKEKNKEKIKEKAKEYKEENKEKIKEQKKEQNKKYREKNKEYQKEYLKTEKGKKCFRIQNWKKRGIKSDNYDSLYEYYLNVKNCELCEIELVEGCKSNSRCLDHCHSTKLFRNVLCNSCNVKRK